MILFREVVQLRNYLGKQKLLSKTVGFVPTMGALHQGHITLISLARQHTDLVVCSIFINPTQFNDPADYQKYPVTLSSDIYKLEQAGTDIIFLPSVSEVYPDGFETKNDYDLDQLDHVLEGSYRPGHFQGVSQVVHRLLDIVQPDKLFLGQKDYQQCLVIRKMISTLTLPVSPVVAPTVRESSGLAMSSRNLRLNDDEREKASAIYQTLRSIKNNVADTPIDKLIDYSEKFLLKEGFSKVDYVAIANATTLEPVTVYDSSVPMIALVAAFLKDVRLIDNMLLNADLSAVQG